MVPETLYKWGASSPLHLFPSLHPFNALSILERKQVWPGASQGKQWLNKGSGSVGGCWLVADVLPDTSKVRGAKSHCGRCEELTLCYPHLLLSQKLTQKIHRLEQTHGKRASWFCCGAVQTLQPSNRGTGVQWEVLYGARASPVWGCHQHMCCCHPVACILQIRAAIQPSNKPFTIVIFVCLGQRQTCNVQRKTWEGQELLQAEQNTRKNDRMKETPNERKRVGAVPYGIEEHWRFVCGTCVGCHTQHIRLTQN